MLLDHHAQVCFVLRLVLKVFLDRLTYLILVASYREKGPDGDDLDDLDLQGEVEVVAVPEHYVGVEIVVVLGHYGESEADVALDRYGEGDWKMTVQPVWTSR
jgi:hypothetical protein